MPVSEDDTPIDSSAAEPDDGLRWSIREAWPPSTAEQWHVIWNRVLGTRVSNVQDRLDH